jgi:hypothetical protein
MPTHTAITDGEASTDKPIRQSLIRRLRDNPELVHAGDGSVPSGKRIRVPQALRTDSTDTTLRLGPDGAGGVALLPAQGAIVTNATGPATIGAGVTVISSIPISSGHTYLIHAHASWTDSSLGYYEKYADIFVTGGAIAYAWPLPFVYTIFDALRVAIVSGNLQLQAHIGGGNPWDIEEAHLLGIKL